MVVLFGHFFENDTSREVLMKSILSQMCELTTCDAFGPCNNEILFHNFLLLRVPEAALSSGSGLCKCGMSVPLTKVDPGKIRATKVNAKHPQANADD